MAELTNKQKLFVKEYLKDLNATQAMIRAGYSEKTAPEQASRLLRNVNVKDAIEKANEKRIKKVEIDAEWVLSQLKLNTELSRAMADFNASNKSLELLGKHLKLFTDRLETENTNVNMSYEEYLKKVNDSDEY